MTKILFVSPEVTPFAKVGGLADVAGSLPVALKKLGLDIQVIMPKYKHITEEKFDLELVKESITVSTNDRHHFPRILKSNLPGSDVPIFFIDEESIFSRENIYNYPDDTSRFVFFDKAVLEFCKETQFKPDIIHFNDWHTCFIPIFLKTLYKDDPFFKDVKTLMSIHNIQYQGITTPNVLQYAQIPEGSLTSIQIDKQDGDINYMYEGISNADYINTVSQTYAKEILTPEFGMGMETLLKERSDTLTGIINGIDINAWSPEKDTFIKSQYSATNLDKKSENKKDLQNLCNLPEDDSIPVIGMVTRIAGQKGFDIFLPILRDFLKNNKVQFVILGKGDEAVENTLSEIEKEFPDKLKLHVLFDESLAHKIYAGSDFFFMPSMFEPCGLGQLIAMRYGSIPIVRKTGGLADTVTPFNDGSGDGFVFEDYTKESLSEILELAIKNYSNISLIEELRERIMKKDFSWNHSAKEYKNLYLKILK